MKNCRGSRHPPGELDKDENATCRSNAASAFEPNDVRDAIAKVDCDSIYGRVRFGENGQIAMPQTVIQIQDDKVVEIFTDRFINRPVYPVPAWDKRS
jgi:branched-chain amino acid transport system substrate-binding protein